MSLAIAALVMAIFAFFFPVQSNYIKGNIEGAMGFTREWYTYSYTVTGGYLLILAAIASLYAAIRFNEDPQDRRELLFWSGVSIVLMISTYYAGRTLFNSWLPGVPSEVQGALGTPYADYRVSILRNIPQIVSSAFIVAFAMTAIFDAWRKRAAKNQEVHPE